MEALEPELSDIVDAIGDAVVRRRADGRLVFVNAAFRRAFGGALADWVGATFDFTRDNETGAPGGRRRYDATHDTVAGPALYEWEETPLADGGAIAVGRDVSAARAGADALKVAREAAETAAEAKDILFATVTHELRTPLNGVLGLAQLLEKTALDPEQRDYVAAIEESGRHLLGLVEDMLDAAKLAAGDATLTPTEVDPRALVEAVAGLVAPRAREKGLDLAVVVDPVTPRRVAADAGRLRQVLLNLVGNAVKFTEAGGVSVSVEAEAVDAAHATLVFKVRDSGPGVAERDRARIFEAFTQGDSSSARRAEGAGLGLSIVRDIVAAMDGELGLDTVPGAGSTFWARVRLAVRAPAELQNTVALAGQRVLVAARGALHRDSIVAQLRHLGADAEPVVDPNHLEPMIAENPDRLVIVEECWAAGVAAHVTEARAALVLVAPDQRDTLHERLGAGYAGWLVTPCRMESFADRVGRAWRGERSTGAPDAADEGGAADARDPGDAALDEAIPVASAPRILLVEDNPVNELLAMSLLGRLGCAAESAPTGEAALEALAARAFDLVFMDMRLPGLDGMETTHRLRAAEGAGRRTPVIALTANATADDRRACLAAGMDDFLVKPVSEEALGAVIARWTEREARSKLRA